jgi:hypothetical protein
MKKFPLILLASFFALISVAALASEEYFPALKKQLKETFSALTTTANPQRPVEEFEPIILEAPAPYASDSGDHQGIRQPLDCRRK